MESEREISDGKRRKIKSIGCGVKPDRAQLR